MSDHPKLPGSARRVTLSPAACSLDIGDGSERGEYVNQDHLLRALGRPHRAINLMYCYYPYDKGWPLRASAAFPQRNAGGNNSAWIYGYDDYFPYGQAKVKSGPREPFSEIRDIRRHGQDVTLTMTFDLKTSDAHLIRIARELRPYGHLKLRINHECDGFWFAFNRRYSRVQVTEFFIRFHQILKREAPLVKTMCCWGTWDREKKEVKFLAELAPMLRYADVWAVDKYLTLHWSVEDCDEGKKGYSAEGLQDSWDDIRQVQKVFAETTGIDKPLEIGEFNADGDVGGERSQAFLVRGFYRKVLAERPKWLSGITYYQFRDRGKLGLEYEDPNDPSVGIPIPLLQEYREIIQNPYFLPKEKWERAKDRSLRWTASDEAEGLGWKVPLKGKPMLLELFLPKPMNLMIKVGRLWFYKKPGVTRLDVSAGIEDRKVREIPVSLFAPPADGVNAGGASSVRARLPETPRFRLRLPWKKWKF